MSIAATSKSRIAYVAEATFGTTPTTPTLKEIRRTGGSLDMKKGTVRSDQIQLDRNVRAEYMVSHDVTGSIDFELNNASFDDFIEAVLGGTWGTNVVKVGNTQKFFTIEETVDFGGGSFGYIRNTGSIINTLDLNIAARQAARGSIGIMGKQQAYDTAIVTGATYTAPNAEAIFTADKVASLSVVSLSPAPIVKSLSLQISNNARIRDQVGSLYTEEFGVGQVDITGRLSAYFASNALAAQVLAHGTGALSFTIGVDANKKISISLPNIQLLNGSPRLGGPNDDVMIDVDFRALYDSSSVSSIVVTRLVA